MKFLLSSLRLAALAAVVGLPLAASALAESVKVELRAHQRHLRDGRENGRGGFPKLATAVKAERAANPNTCSSMPAT